eukprot:4104714-Amphidinium_carterae.3
MVGPKLRVRPEQWPRVSLPAPEPECERHVGVQTGRSCFNYHALKGRRCVPLKRSVRSWFPASAGRTMYHMYIVQAEPPLAGVS